MMKWFCRLADRLRRHGRARRWNTEQAAGRLGEDLAHRFLERKGFTVVARNYRTRSGNGEIDLVAWDGPTLVFVEVKSRATDEYGSPERNVGEQKRRALIRAGREYARRADIRWDNVRFDLISILLREPPSIQHISNAFMAEWTL
jgi:putative endonuclease